MTNMSDEAAGDTSLAGADQRQDVGNDFQVGQAPLKVITGTQTTRELNFELKPGAIVAHEGSSVIFVCG